MNRLKEGIVEVDGVVLSPETTLADVENIGIDKGVQRFHGNQFLEVLFNEPVESDGVTFQVSIRIARWYADSRDSFLARYEDWYRQLETLVYKAEGSPVSENVHSLLPTLYHSGLQCIEMMGISLRKQDPTSRQAWESTANRLRTLCEDRKDVLELLTAGQKVLMKPVFDALEDRDFKQYDRDLAFAVIDMIA